MCLRAPKCPSKKSLIAKNKLCAQGPRGRDEAHLSDGSKQLSVSQQRSAFEMDGKPRCLSKYLPNRRAGAANFLSCATLFIIISVNTFYCSSEHQKKSVRTAHKPDKLVTEVMPSHSLSTHTHAMTFNLTHPHPHTIHNMHSLTHSHVGYLPKCLPSHPPLVTIVTNLLTSPERQALPRLIPHLPHLHWVLEVAGTGSMASDLLCRIPS